MKTPLISVIITTFNRAHLVGNTIESVKKQDYPNFELIVVDDCSTDSTEQYFQENWVNELTYVRHEVNRGVQFASNTGYRYAKGKYLAFIGDDDVWSDVSKLSKQVAVFEGDHEELYGIVTTWVRVVRKDQSMIKEIQRPENLLRHLMSQNGIIYGSAALLRRSVFERAGLFAEDLPKGTDSDVYRRIAMLGYDVSILNEAMVDYHEDSSDRMTCLSEKNIFRSIIAINYLFSRYNAYFAVYPEAKSKRLLALGQMYYELFLLKKQKVHLKTARQFYFRSWVARMSNMVALKKMAMSMKKGL